MADRSPAPDTPELRERWGGFEFTEAWAAKADAAIARYPEGRQRSAVMALLDFAQRQVGEETGTQGWLPLPVIEYVADYLDMPVIRVLEVASFYTMYNLAPVGRFHVQVCGTTPCMLRGAGELKHLLEQAIGPAGARSRDGRFSWEEVECMGACANAPMAAINDLYYEDLTPKVLAEIIAEFAADRIPAAGSYGGRKGAEPEGGPLTLTDPALYDGSRARPLGRLPNIPEPS